MSSQHSLSPKQAELLKRGDLHPNVLNLPKKSPQNLKHFIYSYPTTPPQVLYKENKQPTFSSPKNLSKH